MPVRPLRILSGWRVRRTLRAGGMIVRDGAAFRIYQKADERCRCCGRLPPHIVVRLKGEALLIAFRGDPDRQVQSGPVPAMPLKPFAASDPSTGKAPASLMEQAASKCAEGLRLRAAASRFEADYQLAASPGRSRADDPRQIAAARARLLKVENELGTERVEQAEMLVLDRLTLAAFRHVSGLGLIEARAVLTRLAEAYGLLAPDQAVGSAFASS